MRVVSILAVAHLATARAALVDRPVPEEQVPRDHQVQRELPVLQGLPVRLVPLETQGQPDQRVLQVRRVRQATPVQLVLRALPDLRDLPARLARQDRQGRRARQDLQAQLVRPVPLVIQDRLGLQVQRGQRDRLGRPEVRVPRARPVTPDPPDQPVQQVPPELLARPGRQVPLSPASRSRSISARSALTAKSSTSSMRTSSRPRRSSSRRARMRPPAASSTMPMPTSSSSRCCPRPAAWTSTWRSTPVPRAERSSCSTLSGDQDDAGSQQLRGRAAHHRCDKQGGARVAVCRRWIQLEREVEGILHSCDPVPKLRYSSDKSGAHDHLRPEDHPGKQLHGCRHRRHHRNHYEPLQRADYLHFLPLKRGRRGDRIEKDIFSSAQHALHPPFRRGCIEVLQRVPSEPGRFGHHISPIAGMFLSGCDLRSDRAGPFRGIGDHVLRLRPSHFRFHRVG